MLIMLDWERPYLVLFIRPHINRQTDYVVHARLMGLIHENSGYTDNRDNGKAENNTTVKAGAGYASRRPFQ